MSSPLSRRHLLGTLAGLSAASLAGITAGLPPSAAAREASEPSPAVDEALRALRAGGVAVLMRHARTTAGSGDPPGYRFDDCSTQRNLDDAGRAHAERVGQWYAKNGIAPVQIRNSPWCRCRDTAQLAFERSADWPALGNIFDRELQPSHVAEVRRFVAQLKAGQVAVLVSHGVTIAALSGEHPSPAEGVLVRAGDADRLAVVARLVIA